MRAPKRGRRGRLAATDAATRAWSSSTTSAVGTNGSATTLASLSDAAATGRPSTSATTAGACSGGAESSAGSLSRMAASRCVAVRRAMVLEFVMARMVTLRPGSPHRADGARSRGPPLTPLHTAGMRFWSHDRHGFPLPQGHRFPLPKYRLLREAVEREGLGAVCGSEAAPGGLPAAVHDAPYLERVRGGGLTRREERALGLPWSPELVERGRRSTFGTVHAARDALSSGYGMNLGGGTHHAAHAQGRGYCLFNDVAVAVAALRADGALGRVLVVDC